MVYLFEVQDVAFFWTVVHLFVAPCVSFCGMCIFLWGGVMYLLVGCDVYLFMGLRICLFAECGVPFCGAGYIFLWDVVYLFVS